MTTECEDHKTISLLYQCSTEAAKGLRDDHGFRKRLGTRDAIRTLKSINREELPE